SPLPELAVQYADYTLWQRSWLRGEELQRQLSYWREQLSGAPAALELPTDRARPAVASFRGAKRYFTLPKELSTQVLQLARAEGVTLFMVLLAAFQALLYRLTGQSDVLVGSPIAGRTHRQTEELIGFFVNTLVLRTQLRADESFQSLLQRVKEVTLGAYAHQDLPFEKLVAELQPERDLSRQPLFQVAFAFQNLREESLRLVSLETEAINFEHVTSKVELSLYVFEHANGLEYMFEYATDLFGAETIERWGRYLEHLLRAVATDRHASIATLSLMGTEERDRLLLEWNNTDQPAGPEHTIHDLLAFQAARTPNATALEFGTDRMTYAELDQRANQVARHLQSLGVVPETCVGLCIERSFEMVVGLFGILKAGAAYLPLDEEYPHERLQFMLDDSGAQIVVTEARLDDKIAKTGRRVVRMDADWPTISLLPRTLPASRVDSENLAYVIYTSGSAGKPKGVLVRHAGFCSFIAAQQHHLDIRADDRVLQFARISFDVSLWEIAMSVRAGATLCLIPSALARSSSVARILRDQRISAVVFVASSLQFLDGHELPDLRMMIVGGEVCAIELADYWASRCKFVSGYGPTEATVATTLTNYGGGAERLPIGRAIANTKLYVLDANGEPTPIGVPGELHIGGAALARGYLRRAGLTAARFVANPFGQGDRLYRTGDLVRYAADGNLEFIGRIDEQVKIRGFRIELGEIESALLSLSSIRQAIVDAREDVPGTKQLVAYFVTSTGMSPSVSELRQHLKRTLPEHMIPAAFVQLSELPTTSGKIDRKALPAPPREAPRDNSYAPPTTAVQTALATIWSEVLHRDRIGIHDNFFELGGDSIQLIKIVSRVNELGINLTARHMFESQTIAELAAAIPSITILDAQQDTLCGPVALTPIQHWFFESEPTEPHHFNQAVLLKFARPVSAQVLEQAVSNLISHHDVLRSRFLRTDNGWSQDIVEHVTHLPLECIDISGLSQREQDSTVDRIGERMHRSMELSSAPLSRTALFQGDADEPQTFLWIIHHLLVDGVSWRILLDDLQANYLALEAGRKISLPRKSTSYQRWSELLASYATSLKDSAESKYWRTRGWTECGRLPYDGPGPNRREALKYIYKEMSASETEALLGDVATYSRVKPNELLLTALAQTLAHWMSNDRVLIDLEGHGREGLFAAVDVSRTVGCFTSLFPLALDLRGMNEPYAALMEVKQQLRSVPNQGIGYGIQRYLAKDLLDVPSAQVSFNYLGRLDHERTEGALFEVAQQSTGQAESLQGLRTHLLNVSASIWNGQLQMRWAYCADVHSSFTIETIADQTIERVRDLVASCLEDDVSLDPTDFPLIELGSATVTKASP
ncbi:MAG TPA: amino acid adenylation domain-containing protein, partial [Steroidobacteraceae bacterium]|nr:amino acid adenylation domain-containing protein [Steroidobacteraceae bacterium]